VRHITPGRLDAIEPLLADVRDLDGLVERKRGTFYRRSRAFLHFHEHGDGIFADVRLGGDGFERMKVTTTTQQRRFVTRVRRWLATQP
jgi:hypothetical protein